MIFPLAPAPQPHPLNMRTIFPAAATVAAWLLTIAPLPAEPFQTFSTEAQAKLRTGEVLVWNDKSGKKRFVHSAVLLDHPLAQVWALLDDKEASPTIIPSVRSAKLISREANVCVIAQETEAPGTGRTFSYMLQHTLTYPSKVDFVRLSGDLRHIEGCWFFDPVDDGKKTLLVYDLHLDAGMLVPQGFIANSQMKALPGIMTSIRTKLASQVWPPAPSATVPGGLTSAPAPAPVPPVASSGTTLPLGSASPSQLP